MLDLSDRWDKQDRQAKKEMLDLSDRLDKRDRQAKKEMLDLPDSRAKRDRPAKKELLDLPDRWDQKAIRVRQAQWGQLGRRVTRGLKVKLDRPVPRASQDSAS